MLLKDHLNIFREKCFVWRREKWYFPHLHMFTVFKVVMIFFFLRISKATQFKIPFTFNLNIEHDVIYFPCFIITFGSTRKELEELHKFMLENFEDYESRGEEVYQRLLKLTGYLKWLTYTNDILASIFMAALIFSESQQNSFLYIFVLVQGFQQNPILYWSLIISYYLFAFYNLRIGFSSLYLFFYLMLHYILQFILLREGAKALQNYSGNDQACQLKVKIELKRLAQHSQTLTRFHNKVMHVLRIPSLVVLCMLVICVTGGYFTTFFVSKFSF
ncbi:uncharacterized protein LOC123310408 [Coccinella septempunctata]|uniref:uncharacterized protein LOC123310408 n=1 Tax=Coccinella septempunctata TaxID=41139 RepID=UPI001D08E533|nr:uncharacterized protein LOC123310408 [Coccinella septempunctata]